MTSGPSDDDLDSLETLYDDPESRVNGLRELQPPDDEVAAQRRLFQALAHEDRLRLLSVLDTGECNVYELQLCLDLPQSTVANHLRTLREAGLVTSRKKGKWSYYRVADVALFELLELARVIQER